MRPERLTGPQRHVLFLLRRSPDTPLDVDGQCCYVGNRCVPFQTVMALQRKMCLRTIGGSERGGMMSYTINDRGLQLLSSSETPSGKNEGTQGEEK